jgi:putative transposase
MAYPCRIVPGTTYLLARRCTRRRFMLVPRGIVPELFGYCVALAAERHGILVHATTVCKCPPPSWTSTETCP